ncbi:twin-arginine translocase TatA/TatE family subunit [Arenibaculum pallidiluteum]|uniref:twin-arginine translocase TatA/TatE family subunit n=1 Tax=Arenibaculum pallidiluteum TaxID=2812559 RepID=UPI001A96FAD7|nr:twin-arginine translocase TatA/TatE family subunit [Arenibaculum pallidiluteum]
MGSFSLMHWLVVLLVVVLLFGAGRLPQALGDVARGVKAFKRGMREEDEKPASIEPPPATAEKA